MATTEKETGFPHHDVESVLKQEPSHGSHGHDAAVRSPEEKALLWKQDLRIIPLSAFIYFLCYLDRSNIGNAKILNSSTKNDMQSECGMSNYDFNIALMVFLIAYAIFEVPSNILLKKLRPSRWLSFLMLAWGATTIGLGGTHSFGSVTAVRFILGMCEAGLFPGLVYYFTFWYKNDERSLRIAIVLSCATLSGAFGGAIAYGVGHMNGTHGLSAWRWLFILEGLPSCLSAILVFLFLPDWPEQVGWLTAQEKELAISRLELEASKSSDRTMSWADAKATLTDWRLYAHYAVYFAVSTPFASMSLFIPSITAGLGYQDLRAQLMTVPPWAVAYVVQILVAWSADHFNARGLHSCVFATIGAVGFVVSAALPPTSYAERYGALIIGAAGTFACVPPMLGWLTSNVWSTASVGLAVAINVSVGAGAGQIPGVWIYKAEEKTMGFPTGHWTNAGLLFTVAIITASLRVFYGWKNKKLIREARGGPVRLYVY
jgi:sugar phosphate permease